MDTDTDDLKDMSIHTDKAKWHPEWARRNRELKFAYRVLQDFKNSLSVDTEADEKDEFRHDISIFIIRLKKFLIRRNLITS